MNRLYFKTDRMVASIPLTLTSLKVHCAFTASAMSTGDSIQVVGSQWATAMTATAQFCTVSSFELPSFDIPIRECIQGSDALPPQVSLIALIPLTLCPKFGKARNPTGDKNKIKVPQFGVHQTVIGRIGKAILMEVPGFVLF